MRNKWHSRRWLVCVWAIAMVTSIIIYSLLTNYSPDWMGTAIGFFQMIIGGYIAADSLTKPKGFVYIYRNGNCKRNKWHSRRWLVCVWAIAMTTIIISYSLITQHSPDWMGLAIGLYQMIIGGYIAADSLTKPKGGDGG
jgi:uncharacterized membrane protein (DUF485 family)